MLNHYYEIEAHERERRNDLERRFDDMNYAEIGACRKNRKDDPFFGLPALLLMMMYRLGG